VFDESVEFQIKEHNNQQKIEKERDSFHVSSIYVCEFEFHKSQQTQFEKIEIEIERLKEREDTGR
jgi:hypothetical protein